jgi:hypothetical protein
MGGTERLNPTAMFVPIEEWFQRKSNHSQKQSRCQTKKSISPGCGESFPMCALNPQRPLRPRRDAPSLLLSGFSMELEARIWFAAPQRRDLRAMKTRPSAPGKINAPPRLTSQKHFAGIIPTFPYAGPIFQEPDWKKKKRRNVELSQVSPSSLLEGSVTREAAPGLRRGQKVCPTRAISVTLKINTPWDLRCRRGP